MQRQYPGAFGIQCPPSLERCSRSSRGCRRLRRPPGIDGRLAADSPFRRWDTQFDGPHAVFVERVDGGDHLWWMDRQAGNSYQGEFIPLADARRYYEGGGGGAVYTHIGGVKTTKVRTDQLARLFALENGVARPIELSSGSFTFSARAGDNVTLKSAPDPCRSRRHCGLSEDPRTGPRRMYIGYRTRKHVGPPKLTRWGRPSRLVAGRSNLHPSAMPRVPSASN